MNEPFRKKIKLESGKKYHRQVLLLFSVLKKLIQLLFV
ncbi:hypothetical protein RV09_GL002993 [Enterococcus moraviensis]|nr:hypothetical protein RV09_GL002993 [Enterococcus moraviensis]